VGGGGSWEKALTYIFFSLKNKGENVRSVLGRTCYSVLKGGGDNKKLVCMKKGKTAFRESHVRMERRIFVVAEQKTNRAENARRKKEVGHWGKKEP